MAVSGVLNVCKPPGPTSFEVVRQVRCLTGEKRVGHGGTLDPLAEGILIVLMGKAARLSRYLLELPKEYRVEARLGQATTTYDAQGEVTLEADPSSVTEEALREALAHFVGEVRQVPPPFSAVKVGGSRAYAQARAGRQPLLAPRTVHIYRLRLVELRLPFCVLEVECGRGTYVRSLVHDLGLQLGCGAHVVRLVRTRIGPFAIADAVPMERLAQEWPGRLLPIDAVVSHLPAAHLDEVQSRKVAQGQPLPLAALPLQTERLRAYDAQGELLAILRRDAKKGIWHPETVLTG